MEGRFNGGFLRYEFGGLLFGGADTWRGLFSQFYGICKLHAVINFSSFFSFCRNTVGLLSRLAKESRANFLSDFGDG